MKNIVYFIVVFFINSNTFYSQSIDDMLSQKKMQRDLKIFKEIRLKANSGLYKYRTKEQIDSIYQWAESKIKTSKTYLDFYNVICQLTDFEGSCHNETQLPEKYLQNLRKESTGYFPYPFIWIDGKWIINIKNEEVPIGAEIISINNTPISEIIAKLYKYYTTDGENITGKRIGIRTNFSKYYRFNFGLKENFQIKYKDHNSNLIESKTIKSVGYINYYKNFNNRYSKPYDQIYYADLQQNEKYNYKTIDAFTGILTINTFEMGSENSTEHKMYVAFLDSIFTTIKSENLKNLIVDIRQNGGGTDPNDLVTYSYLSQRNFQENKQAWVSFKKIPFLNYYDINVPKFLRPFGVTKFNKEFQSIFPIEKNGAYFQNEFSNDQMIRTPNKNNFTGQIYLLISPAVASAGSLFAAMVAGNSNTITIGEETMGGYYGHNGHSKLEYKLPKSKFEFDFSVVNLEQDVPKKENQYYNRGILPDYEVTQKFEDFLIHKDTQMEFVLSFIKLKSINE